MPSFSPAACLALVERSPAAVAAHDKQAWLGLFASYNIVEDPVGSAPHLSGVYDARDGRRGNGPLSRFYDTFIAPNTISFEVERDIVCGLHVVRDLTIAIQMSPHLTVRVPMHLLYELREEGGELRVFRLAAHWELVPMLRQQLSFSWHNLSVGTVAGWRMLSTLGPAGTLGFLRALRSVGNAGKRRVALFARYFNQGDSASVQALFAGAAAEVAVPATDATLPIHALAECGGELRFDKTLAAGSFVTATVHYRTEAGSYSGVAFFEFDRGSLEVVALSLYWENAGQPTDPAR